MIVVEKNLRIIMEYRLFYKDDNKFNVELTLAFKTYKISNCNLGEFFKMANIPRHGFITAGFIVF